MLLSNLLCCFGGPRQSGSSFYPIDSHAKNAHSTALLDQHTATVQDKCVFCNPTPDKFDIILENDRFVVFTDRSPAAQNHLLAVPRWHVRNVKYLHGKSGAELVDDLLAIGTKALNMMDSKSQSDSKAELQEAKETRFGFHIPPFRSVDHIHLHCLALPFSSPYKALKYRIAPGDPSASPPTHKGWSWFVTAEQTSAILREGGSIGVSPC